MLHRRATVRRQPPLRCFPKSYIRHKTAGVPGTRPSATTGLPCRKPIANHAAERAALGIPPLPLDAKQTAELIELIKNPPAGEGRLPDGSADAPRAADVDDAAKVKASFLAAVAHGDRRRLVSKAKATELLGTMVGGYNVHPLIDLLDDATSPAWPPRA